MTDALWPDSDGDAAEQALRDVASYCAEIAPKHEQAVRLETVICLDALTLWADCWRFGPAPPTSRGMTDRVSCNVS